LRHDFLVHEVTRLDPRRFTLGTVSEAYGAIKAGTALGQVVVDGVEEASKMDATVRDQALRSTKTT
jgi:hypothetical protein